MEATIEDQLSGLTLVPPKSSLPTVAKAHLHQHFPLSPTQKLSSSLSLAQQALILLWEFQAQCILSPTLFATFPQMHFFPVTLISIL